MSETTETSLDLPVEKPVVVKPKKKRTMTPELLEKLALARDRAKELRDSAKAIKASLPVSTSIPDDVEKTKVAKYLATKKYLKEQIIQDIHTEQSEPVEKIVKKKEKIKSPETSDSEDEMMVIRIPKKKMLKYQKKLEQVKPAVPPRPTFDQTQHLMNMYRGGYTFQG
jgi:hypothetical protein